ncbi:MAG: NAD(P)H-dependent oxidoreductase subunit E [Bacteroidetes bacterium]|nr:NAD(P)H-dependent oxidoreductase subunit E [Bacteroidota bacterium]
MKEKIISIIESYGRTSGRLMDILLSVQAEFRCVSEEAVSLIASELGVSEADVNQTKTFYHFFTTKPVGKYAVYMNNSVTSVMKGMYDVVDEFEKQAGIKFGQTTPDGLLSLNYTACIGMSDQEPAALINNVVFTELTRDKVRKIYSDMRDGKPVEAMFNEFGDGNNANQLVKTMVKNNIRRRGNVTLGEYEVGKGLTKALSMSSQEVIDEIKNSNLRGRGGAGFPTGLKWQFCSKETGDKYVMCNADEGEPGTFKDRVLLTERAHMIFEGMAVAGYAIGAKEGVLYLRHEYKYLKAFMESVLAELRNKNILGNNILGKGFNFDIRVQFGAGAYVCGEESALIESSEGKRGEPRNRPPFPVQRGYNAKPTVINNVETFCSVVKIIENGSAWYRGMGTEESAGTKLLSISGDCKMPGVYEIEWGMTIADMLQMVGAEDVQAVQVAGPSGICLPPSQFNRKIAIEDLPTGGSMIVIGANRDLIKDVVLNFMEFFEDESCGSCVTCRSFNMILRKQVKKVVDGRGIKSDLDNMLAWGEIMRKTSRCGLGQTASNPVSTTIKNFLDLYNARVKDAEYQSDFDMHKAIEESCEVVGRPANIHE